MSEGIVVKKPTYLKGEVETNEVYIVAGHKGHPKVVARLGQDRRRRKLCVKRGRGAFMEEKPPILGLLQRNSEFSIQMLPNVQLKMIQPIITKTVAAGSMIYSDEYEIYSRLKEWGYGHKSVNHSAREYARDEEGDVFMKSTSTRWKVLGPCFALCHTHIAAFPKKIYLVTRFFSSSSTKFVVEVGPCCIQC